MHEFAICRSLVEAALEEARRHGGAGVRLRRARVVVGRLHQIVPASLEAAYDVLTRGTAGEGSALEIEWRPVTVVCGACGWTGEIEPPFFVCARCHAGRVDLTGGKELYLDAVEIEHER